MKDLEIKFAEKSDMKEILEIKKQSHVYFVESRPDIYKDSNMLYTKEFFNGFFNDTNKHIVIAKIKDHIAGYAFVQMFDVNLPMMTNRKYMYVHDMAVSEPHRHQGIAKNLLHFIEEYAIEQGATKLELAVHLFNDNAISLYEKIGFYPRSVRMEKDIGADS